MLHVKIFLHVAEGRLGPSKNHEVPRNGLHAFFRFCLELSLDVHYTGVVRCTWGTGLSPKDLSYYQIPNTNTIRLILSIRQNVRGHLFWLCVAQVISPNCIKHTAGGFWKLKNSGQCANRGKVRPPLPLNSTLNGFRLSFKLLKLTFMVVKSLRRRMYECPIMHTSVVIVDGLDGTCLASGNYSDYITHNLLLCARPIKSLTFLFFKNLTGDRKIAPHRLHTVDFK